jgi:radical SAM protein with 4Fe4S-binding SPASM domain
VTVPLIDEAALDRAYANDGIYALQLEVGDTCHQGCIYCYMNALPREKNSLSDELISEILEDAHRLGVTAIEWLGGEPLLRKSIFDLMAQGQDLGFRNNVWTGGLPLINPALRQKTAEFCCPGLISVHVSTVDPALYTLLHPDRPKRNLPVILEAVADLLAEGYPPEQMLNSVTFTGLQTAEDTIATIDYFEERFGIRSCLNVYHTYLRPGSPQGELARFIPADEEVARVYERFSQQWGLESFPMNCVNKQYCSATVAVLCDGHVTPCATIRDPKSPSLHQNPSLARIVTERRDELIFRKFKVLENLPADCQMCPLGSHCWGCRSRSFAAGLGLYGKDPRCFRPSQP